MRYEQQSTYRKYRDIVAVGAYVGGALLSVVGGVEHSGVMLDAGIASEIAAPVIAVAGRLIGRKPPKGSPYPGEVHNRYRDS